MINDHFCLIYHFLFALSWKTECSYNISFFFDTLKLEKNTHGTLPFSVACHSKVALYSLVPLGLCIAYDPETAKLKPILIDTSFLVYIWLFWSTFASSPTPLATLEENCCHVLDRITGTIDMALTADLWKDAISVNDINSWLLILRRALYIGSLSELFYYFVKKIATLKINFGQIVFIQLKLSWTGRVWHDSNSVNDRSLWNMTCDSVVCAYATKNEDEDQNNSRNLIFEIKTSLGQ